MIYFKGLCMQVKLKERTAAYLHVWTSCSSLTDTSVHTDLQC